MRKLPHKQGGMQLGNLLVQWSLNSPGLGLMPPWKLKLGLVIWP